MRRNKIVKKFSFTDTRTKSEKVKSFFESLLFWRGRKKGMIHTRNIQLRDLRFIFFPKGFDKYGYLGITFFKEDGEIFNSLYPLVLAMDHEAKPYWCPRWFLRFLHVFGNDMSIVRVRNRALHNLHRKLTMGIQFWDWKTKWYSYDLRISISAPKHLQNLADDIERGFYKRGYEEELIEKIKNINPNYPIVRGSSKWLEEQLEILENDKETK